MIKPPRWQIEQTAAMNLLVQLHVAEISCPNTWLSEDLQQHAVD